ncbi:YrzE family protein [Nitrosomonas supralitoralis]|uniref:Uncharacterized protein n=1 Tax=Nitrosomonas supralitoralis TaxID=2116706 RepID=A0A2P7NSE2_9PROT|nr:YrzE family protein [Nitrosomonas supralitoralis]PSJ16370.1 hypothetical protein C7H79_13780 [Nitrosomonas supralitoralis]
MSIHKEALPDNYSQTGLTINWGSILAGLVFILALGWLLFTLSSAIGLSIVEVQGFQGDMTTESTGLGIAAIIWVLGSVIATYFLGGFLSGTVSGRSNKAIGILHGIVLWSCTIIIGIVFSVFGVSGIMNAASGAVKSLTSTGGSAISLIAGQNDVTTSQVSSYLHPLMGSLKQGIHKAIEREQQANNKDSGQYRASLMPTSEGQENKTQNVAPQKGNSTQVEETDDKSANEVNIDDPQSLSTTPQNHDSSSSSATESGNSVENGGVEQGVIERTHERDESEEASRFEESKNYTDQENSDNENMAERDTEENQSVQGINSQNNQQSLPTAINEDSTITAGTASNEKEEGKRDSEPSKSTDGSKFDESNNYTDNHHKSEDRKQGSPSKREKSVTKDGKRHIEKIDPQVLNSIAIALIQGDEKHAKEVITSNFDINNAEVDTLIRTFKQKADQVAKKLEVKINEAKDYAAGVLWVIFLSYLIGLVACISGAQLALRFPNMRKADFIRSAQ